MTNSTTEETNKTVIGSYLATLSTFEVTKVSEVNQHDSKAVMACAAKGIKNKQLVADVANAYHVISGKLDSAVKTHMNLMAENFNKGAPVYNTGVVGEQGSLVFQKPSMYLISTNTENPGSQMVSPSDNLLAYEFLLFRSVSGTDAYNMSPSFLISFKEKGAAMYNNADILKSFKYKINLVEEYPFHGTKANPKTLSMFKEEKTELTGIVKKVFSSFAHDCAKLQGSEPVISSEVCRNSHDFGDPDYALKMFTCFEVFQMTKVGDLCKEPVYDNIEF